MSTKEQVFQTLNTLSERELEEVSRYLTLLKARERGRALRAANPPPAEDYAEFAAEDRELAEEGMMDYAEQLRREDAAP